MARRFPDTPGWPTCPLLQAPAASSTRSELEDAFLSFCRRFAQPRPEVNTMVCGSEVDARFGGARVIVELDGWAFHGRRDSSERDRNRDADTLVGGYVTLRITWDRIVRRHDREAEPLAAILAQRRRES